MGETTSGAGLAVDQWLCVALADASRAMTARYRALLDPVGLTYPQYILMSWLWQDGEASVSGLAEHMGLDRSTLTPLVKRLESAGLVQRQRDEVDERRVLVSLTARGSALRHDVTHVPGEVSDATGLNTQAQLDLVATLQELTASLTAAAPAAD